MRNDRLDAVLRECAPVAEAFARAGYRLFLVGGIVRDLLGGVDQNEPDFDFTTDALPPVVKELLGPLATSLWTQGERFGTIAAWVGGRLYEVTTHRAELYDRASRKPNVTFSRDVETDLSRRDFTINAMALELTANGTVLIDPFGGAEDLARRRLRTPLGPDVSFSDDPLRMLRAARFIARLDAVPEASLFSAASDLKERLQVVSVERVRAEFDNILGLDHPEAGLRFLVETGLSNQFVPELDLPSVRQVALVSAPSHASVGVAGAGLVERRLAMLFVSSPDRESAVSLCRDRMKALKYSTAEILLARRLVAAVGEVLDLVAAVSRVDSVPDPIFSDAALRRLEFHAPGMIPDAVDLADLIWSQPLSDMDGRSASAVGDLARAIEDLRSREDLDDLDPGLDGAAIMTLLGVPAGPVIGAALRFLQDVRLDVGPLDPDELSELVQQWWREQQTAST